MRALVTGHAGFVGRHMTRALQLRGYVVDGVDPESSVPDERRDCRKFFEYSEHRYDLVVHCAAVVGGRATIDGEPLRLATEDLLIDAALFKWAMRTRPGRIVYFSSSAAYPVGLQAERASRPLRESDVTLDRYVVGMPDATYGWVKLTGELLAAEAAREGIPVHVFRPFSGYGSDQDLAYPFPAIVRRAQEHPRDEGMAVPFRVWGHPGSTRDWVHIDDVVGCVLAHLDADVRGPVNIATGVGTSFSRLASLALEAAGHGRLVGILGDTTKPMGVFHRVGDPSAMLRTYTPRVTVAEGVRRAVERQAPRTSR